MFSVDAICNNMNALQEITHINKYTIIIPIALIEKGGFHGHKDNEKVSITDARLYLMFVTAGLRLTTHIDL